MLKLDAKRDPFWLEILPGQKTQFRPVVPAMVLAGRHHAAGARRQAQDEGKDDETVAIVGQVALCRSIAESGIVAWTGVIDADGEEAEPTAENIEAYLLNWQVFDAIQEQYVVPALVRTDEKNVSSASPNGTSAKGRNTARAAAS